MTAARRTAFVGIGSNMGDSAGIVRTALDDLRGLGANFRNSDLYLTEPWGKTDQPAFINAVASFETDREPRALLEALRSIERALGRARPAAPAPSERWGPRTIDLDLLLLGDLVIDDPELVLPHQRIRERAFVLAPLVEISPATRIPPHGETAAGLLEALPPEQREGAVRLTGTASLTVLPPLDYDDPGGAAENYEALRPFSRFDEAMLSAVCEALGPLDGKRLLDVGCGTGRFTRRLAMAGATVTGLDASERMLSVARGHERANHDGRRIEYMRGNANAGLPGGPFDAITAFYCLQYLDAAALAQNAIRALAASGAIALATFPHRHFAQTEFARYFPSLPAIDMARFPSVPALKAALKHSGFDEPRARFVETRIEDDPVALLERVGRKYLSSFHLIPTDEFERGLARMRADWAGRAAVPRTALGVVVSVQKPRLAR